MKRLQTKPHFSDASLKEILDAQTDVHSFKNWQIVYCVQSNPGKESKEIADMLGVSMSKVLKTIQLYNKSGKDWNASDHRGGRREKRCHLPFEEEKILMKSLESEALSGKILTFRHIKEHVECCVGKEVSEDYIWDLFKRHHWSKKQPRPHHPKADKKEQQAFKKNFMKIWLPKH